MEEASAPRPRLGLPFAALGLGGAWLAANWVHLDLTSQRGLCGRLVFAIGCPLALLLLGAVAARPMRWRARAVVVALGPPLMATLAGTVAAVAEGDVEHWASRLRDIADAWVLGACFVPALGWVLLASRRVEKVGSDALLGPSARRGPARAAVASLLAAALVVGVARSAYLTIADAVIGGALVTAAVIVWMCDQRALPELLVVREELGPASHAYRDFQRPSTHRPPARAQRSVRVMRAESALLVVLSAALIAGLGVPKVAGLERPPPPRFRAAWPVALDENHPLRERLSRFARAYDEVVFVDDEVQRSTPGELVVQLLPDRTCVDRMPMIRKHMAPPCALVQARRAQVVAGGRYGMTLLEVDDVRGATRHFLLDAFQAKRELFGITSPLGAANLSPRGILVTPSPGGLEIRDLARDESVYLPARDLRAIGGFVDDQHVLVIEAPRQGGWVITSLDVAAALANPPAVE
jgi:hypothetical protein